MKISNSSIVMSSTHQESSYSYRESMTMEAAKSKDAVGVILSLSSTEDLKTQKEAMMEYEKMQEQEAAEQRRKAEEQAARQMAERMQMHQDYPQIDMDEYDGRIKMLRKMLAALRGEKYTDEDDCKPPIKDGKLDLRSAHFKAQNSLSLSVSSESAANIAAGRNGGGTIGSGTTWQKITAVSGFTSETEHTTFASKGLVQTADGRSIDFNVEISMSRAFMQEFDFLSVTEYIKTDPLVINLGSNVGSVSDKKFLFDIDSDGKQEKISFAGEGSGFLALDKNNDGKINNGSELFGTKSGDGFRDLAAYDEDHNGWIDENDSIFSKLKVWMKDEDGKDVLLDLKQADVGAIYLKNADTQFSLKDDSNRLNAEIKKTGIYLRESSGAVGTMNHLDLAI